METISAYKPVGGVESVALYPADAVVTALFSSAGCEVELSGSPIEVPLLEDKSKYEESSSFEQGATSVSHLLHLVADRNEAYLWLDNNFLEQATFEGFVAVISLCNGDRLLAGYSAPFGNEFPLRLDAIISSSGSNLRETPSVTLRLISHDTEFSPIINH